MDRRRTHGRILAIVLAVLVVELWAGPRVAIGAAVPDTSITSGPAGLIASRTAIFTFASSIADSKFKCKIDGKTWALCTSPKTYSNLAQGAHTFRVKAIKGTRIDATPAVRTFTVDTVAPDTSVTVGPSGTTLDIRPEFTFSSSDAGSTFECSIDLSAFTTCTSPFDANQMYLHVPHTFQVRARDGAGNLDATPATRTFTIEPIDLGGAPFAEAAADLYFPASVDLDVPAQCGTGGTDCPGGTPLPPSSQIRMQTSDLSVVSVPGANRFDVTATIAVQTLASISVQVPLIGDCALTLDASRGSLPKWTVGVRLPFTYSPTNGDVIIGRAGTFVTGVESQDWQLSGNFGCVIGGSVFGSGEVVGTLLATLEAYWDSVGTPLCEHPAPVLVGPCPGP